MLPSLTSPLGIVRLGSIFTTVKLSGLSRARFEDNPIFLHKKYEKLHSMRNDILKVIKKQNWGALENFGFEKKNGDRKIQNFYFSVTNFFFKSEVFQCTPILFLNYLQYIITHTVLNFLYNKNMRNVVSHTFYVKKWGCPRSGRDRVQITS